MTRKYITPPDRDVYKDLIAESSEVQSDAYARYGGLKPGMTPGSLGLPYWLPEPESRRERLDRAKPTLALIGGVLFVIGAVGLIIASMSGVLS